MTSEDIAALLRTDPTRAVRAITRAKIAGPWTLQGEGRMTRTCYGGETRTAANEDEREWHDMDLYRNGWTLT